MKRILLILSLSVPALAVAFHLFIGAGASRSGDGDWIPPILESTEEPAISTVENGEPDNLKGDAMTPSYPPSRISSDFSDFSSEPTDQPAVSWQFEPGGPIEDPYRLAQVITSGLQENPSATPGLSMVPRAGSWSSLASGGSSSIGGGGSFPLSGGGSFPPAGEGYFPPDVYPSERDIDPPDPILPTCTEDDPCFDNSGGGGDSGGGNGGGQGDSTVSVPEPGTLFLLGAGLASLLRIRRRLEKTT